MNEAKSQKKRISIIVIGSSHDDHGPTIILQKLMKQLITLGLNVFYCDEREEDQTLAQKAQAIQLLDNILCKTNLELPFVRAALSPPDATHAKPYFTRENIESLKAKVKTHYSYSDQQFQVWIESMYRFHAIAATVRLDQYLSSAKISYQGLERPSVEHAKTMGLVYENSQNMSTLEQKRIDDMVTVFFNKVLPKLTNGTVVICDLGALHSHRFAAHVLEKCDAMHDIKVTLACCFSNYYPEEYRQFVFDKIQEMRKQDKPHILKRYETLPPLKTTVLAETKNGNDFESEEFCKVFQAAAMFAKPPKMYFIPNEGARVSLRSCDLDANKRKELGIDRTLLTLDKNCTEKLGLLRSRKEFITVEETCLPHKFLVTFPPEQLDFVTKVASKDWRSLLAVNTAQKTELKGPQ